MNKKIKTDEASKRKKKRAVKVQKAIVGISLDEIRRRRAEKPEARAAQREQALREIKDRKQKTAATKKPAAGGKKVEQKGAVPKKTQQAKKK